MDNVVVLATSNRGKLNEFEALFAPGQFRFIPQSVFNIEDADENGDTFAQNALIKARHAAAQSQHPAIADDSGLIVDALGGAPGIFSARYAGEKGNAERNYHKVLQQLCDVPEEERTARFHCCLVFIEHATDPNPLICSANWEGRILLAPQGEAGFGYDPIFYVPTHHRSAAQLDTAIKNKISHRAQAMSLLREQLMEKYPNV